MPKNKIKKINKFYEKVEEQVSKDLSIDKVIYDIRSTQQLYYNYRTQKSELEISSEADVEN